MSTRAQNNTSTSDIHHEIIDYLIRLLNFPFVDSGPQLEVGGLERYVETVMSRDFDWPEYDQWSAEEDKWVDWEHIERHEMMFKHGKSVCLAVKKVAELMKTELPLTQHDGVGRVQWNEKPEADGVQEVRKRVDMLSGRCSHILSGV